MIFFEFVLYRVRGGIAASPECLDELIAFFVIGELFEGSALFVSNDPADIFVSASAIVAFQNNKLQLVQFVNNSNQIVQFTGTPGD